MEQTRVMLNTTQHISASVELSGQLDLWVLWKTLQVKSVSVKCAGKNSYGFLTAKIEIFICIIYAQFGVINMSCLLFIPSRVLEFLHRDMLVLESVMGKNILLVNVTVLWEIVALQGTVWEAVLHELTFWLDFDKHNLWCCS